LRLSGNSGACIVEQYADHWLRTFDEMEALVQLILDRRNGFLCGMIFGKFEH